MGVVKRGYSLFLILHRPSLIHEYQLTPYSLYAAVSIGLETDDIVTVLDRLSKVKLPKEIEQFVRQCTQSYGKVKLVLQRNRYFVESVQADILQTLLKDQLISHARIKRVGEPNTYNTIQKLTCTLE